MRQRQTTKKVEMLLPKLPPLLSRKVEEIWRRRSKVIDDNGEDLKATHNNKDAKEGQKLNFVETKDNNKKENLGFCSVDPLVCPSSPSFRFYILLSVKDKKNDDNCKNDFMNKESSRNTDIKATANVESQTSIKETTTKMKSETKGMRMWRVRPRGKSMKNLIHIRPCC